MGLIHLQEFDGFREIGNVPIKSISKKITDSVQQLDEKEEIEPFLRSILTDIQETPHGPAELVDIFTHKLSLRGLQGMAAFVIKGKSFGVVRPKDVAHQIYRLEKIDGLKFALFVASGVVLDQAKEQFCSTCERMSYSYSIVDVVDLARLLIAYGFLCPKDGRRISAGRCVCGYSPENRILNILQRESLKNLEEIHALNKKAGVVILPPGSGKTRIAAEDAKAFNAKRVLYVAHTNEILDVAASEFSAKFGSASVMRLNDSKLLKLPKRVNISTIQFISNHIDKIANINPDYLVVDEFHHAAAKTYRRLMEAVSSGFLLGLTATPFRGDRQDILSLCGQSVVVNYELRSGIEMGVLSPYHYFGCFDDIDYSGITYKGGKYDVRDLERALVIPERDRGIILKWKEYGLGKPTVAFCCSISHAKRVADSFRCQGVSSAVYTAETSEAKRRVLTDKFKNGEITVLCVVDVLNEGADLPFIECLLFLRPTESKRIFYQQLGRGLRRSVGKAHCVVIDFIGNFKNAYKIVEYQGLQPFDDDSEFINVGKARSSKEVFNLPLGCEVHFDERVVEVFAKQTLNPAEASRQNIGRILIYQYRRLWKRLGHRPKKIEVDRHCVINSGIYALLFGSWLNFEKIMLNEECP